MSDSLWPHALYSPWNSPGQNTGMGSLLLLQGIFPTQGLNPGLLQCRRILYQLSHKRNPRILEWVAYPFFSRSSQPRNQTGSPALQADSLPTELSGKPLAMNSYHLLSTNYVSSGVQVFFLAFGWWWWWWWYIDSSVRQSCTLLK